MIYLYCEVLVIYSDIGLYLLQCYKTGLLRAQSWHFIEVFLRRILLQTIHI